ncbi:MAG: pyruvate dehydrogenase (acetyl-transferring) E1 component subunit alpha [Reyranella sp.]|uniref:pyruvate dehydrogenase (acetyl-transferring) E1 component subunit alpha n=1 Tax=Reyranella sp. TaxID=1929291 RepID=UPI003D0E737E
MGEISAHFDIQHIRYLGSNGKVIGPLPDFARNVDELTGLYRALVRARTFDAKAVALQRTGRLGTYASSLGQEAVSIGVASAMRADDVLVPSFREQGAQLMRGVTPLELLLYWGGDERGSAFSGPKEDFPVSVPVGSHAPHAAGVALALKLRREPRAAVCIFGDGATSKGDVAEAVNIAGVWQLPLLFVVVNNQWAISTPRERQTAAVTLAQKAIAGGIPGEQVDGNDVIAVRSVTSAALERARRGDGPSLIEALTYRLADHTTADNASRYRDDRMVAERWQDEPLVRLRRYLTDGGHWTKKDEEQLLRQTAAELDVAVAEYLATGPQRPESIFEYTYASMPTDLVAQRDAMLSLQSSRPEKVSEGQPS